LDYQWVIQHPCQIWAWWLSSLPWVADYDMTCRRERCLSVYVLSLSFLSIYSCWHRQTVMLM
jgi:hypothetical protein